MIRSFAAAREPCDKVRVIETGLRTAKKINISYTYNRDLLKSKAQVSLFHQCDPITLLTLKKKKKIKIIPALRSLIDS